MSVPGMEGYGHGSSAPQNVLLLLPDSQAGTGRHKCTICAYQRGFKVGDFGSTQQIPLEACKHGNAAPIAMLQGLAPSQGGVGRHKCAICAYQEGLKAKLLEAERQAAPALQSLPTTAVNGDQGILKVINVPAKKEVERTSSSTSQARKNVDYGVVGSRNRELGLAGELLVIEHEKQLLRNAGRQDLADKVRHVSVVEGDGAGYDVESFTTSGDVKYIEVKTTEGPAETAFYMTSSEVEFAQQHSNSYYLYRVCKYNHEINHGEVYITTGPIEDMFTLMPSQYRVTR